MDSNGPVFEVRFERRLRLSVIGVDARGGCVLFFASRKTTFRAAKGDNEPLRASTTPHTEL
jgi:hypothetical protein